MTSYELTYLISPELDEKKLEEVSQQIEKLAASTVLDPTKGTDTKPKRIRLSYAIKKKTQAFLVSFEFQTSPEKLAEIKKEIEKIPEILRFLIIKKQPSKKKRAAAPEKKLTPSIKAAKKPAVKKHIPKEKKVGLKDIEKELEQIL